MANEITYAAGEKKCDKCGDPLPEIRCSTDKKHFLCSKPLCRFPAHMAVPIQFIKAGERKCDCPGCMNTVPAGAYPAHKKLFFCSQRCRSKYKQHEARSVVVLCAYCGKELRRSPGGATGLRFCQGHGAKYRQDKLDRERCGTYLELFRWYIDEFASSHYRDLHSVRHEIRQFLGFLLSQGVQDIRDVGTGEITRFVGFRKKTKQLPRADFVKVMFDYLIFVGRYPHPNPVHSRLHYSPEPDREPRPYDKSTREEIWKYLDERGDTRSKLLMAMGEDFGPRSKEVCNIRLPDVDFRAQRIWIRNPTKNMTEGYAPFGKRTAKWLKVWLQERDPECGHDYLLTNHWGNPLRTHSLRDLLNGVLRQVSKFRQHKEGLETFSYHALRHTNTTELQQHGVSSRVNMKIHRWKTTASLNKYSKILDSQQIQQYHRAIESSLQQQQQAPTKSQMSLAQFIASRKSADKNQK